MDGHPTGADPAREPLLQPAPVPRPLSPPHAGGPARAPVVFDAPFTDRAAWTPGRTSAYPEDGRNPGDNKLDRVGPAWAPTADGVFRARRARHGEWHTDLVSTEYAPGGFELLPGDELTATCVVHAGLGAWPALWTWGRDHPDGRPQPGHGEVDAFEYHADNPTLLELTNHVRPAARYAEGAVVPGRPFELAVVFGEDGVRWSVDGAAVFDDGTGVGRHWRAWPVVGISVSAGGYGHPSPVPGVRELRWQCAGFTVRRPGGGAGDGGRT